MGGEGVWRGEGKGGKWRLGLMKGGLNVIVVCFRGVMAVIRYVHGRCW